jgi:hypothetical protein
MGETMSDDATLGVEDHRHDDERAGVRGFSHFRM